MGRFRPQLFGGKFHDCAITPNVERQALAGMLFYDFLDCDFERHLSAFFQWKIEDVRWWFCHDFP